MIAYIAVLFYVLSPGVLLRIPEKGSKMMVAAVHAIVFAVAYNFTYRSVWLMTEGFQSGPPAPSPSPTAATPMKPTPALPPPSPAAAPPMKPPAPKALGGSAPKPLAGSA